MISTLKAKLSINEDAVMGLFSEDEIESMTCAEMQERIESNMNSIIDIDIVAEE